MSDEEDSQGDGSEDNGQSDSDESYDYGFIQGGYYPCRRFIKISVKFIRYFLSQSRLATVGLGIYKLFSIWLH